MKFFFFVLCAVLFTAVSCSSGNKNSGSDDNLNDADTEDDTVDDGNIAEESEEISEIDSSDEDAATDSDTAADADVSIDEDDAVPDEDNTVWPPAGCIQGDYFVRFGNFHSHTGNSDGAENPEVAFNYGRDQGDLDMLAVTDHLEQLYTLYGMADDDLPDCIETAKTLSNQGFLALCGYEYGSGFEVSIETGLNISTGHSNVFFNEKLFPMVQLDFLDYYATLENCFECVAQVNHSGDESLKQTFNEFEPYAPIFNKMALYEFNGNGEVWDLYFTALSKGWYLSPTYNQDNHSANWGTANDNRTGVYMDEFSMTGLKNAFLQRRTFATADKNATIRLMAGDLCWMGSQLSGVKKIKISVDAADPDAEGFQKIELFDGMKNVIAQKDCEDKSECRLEYDLEIKFPMHILARSTQTDGQFSVSSPLWFIP